MKTATLARSGVRDYLESLNGKFFVVEFIKRTTGELRKLQATTNLTSHLKGGEASYDAKEKGLLVVIDLQAAKKNPDRAFRSIPLENVLVIRANGVTLTITDN